MTGKEFNARQQEYCVQKQTSQWSKIGAQIKNLSADKEISIGRSMRPKSVSARRLEKIDLGGVKGAKC
jgi:hypothetical protein